MGTNALGSRRIAIGTLQRFRLAFHLKPVLMLARGERRQNRLFHGVLKILFRNRNDGSDFSNLLNFLNMLNILLMRTHSSTLSRRNRCDHRVLSKQGKRHQDEQTRHYVHHHRTVTRHSPTNLNSSTKPAPTEEKRACETLPRHAEHEPSSRPKSSV